MSDNINKNLTLVITAIVAFVGSFMLAAVNVALPNIGSEFGTEAVPLAWISNAALLSSAAFLLPLGRLADIYGRKKIFLWGIVFNSISSFLCGISGSDTALIVFRVFQGIAGSMTVGTSLAIITSVFPLAERGRAMGINVASVYIGLSLSPYLSGLMTDQFGWRSIFFFGAALGLVSAVLSFWKLKGEWAEARGERFDSVGSIIFIIALFVLIYGFTELPDALGIILVILGALGMAAFIWWESKTDSPILDVSAFRKNTLFIFSNMATLINYSATYAVTFLMSLYLQYIMGFSAQTAGLVLITQPAVQAIVSPIAGRISDRFRPQAVAAIGMAFACIGLVMFVFLSEESTLGFIIGTLILFGLGTGLFSSPNSNAVMGSIEKKYFGVASGMLSTMRSCGMTLSMGIVMILFSICIGDVEITPEHYPAFLTSVKVGFIIFAALCFGGIFSQLIGKNPLVSRE